LHNEKEQIEIVHADSDAEQQTQRKRDLMARDQAEYTAKLIAEYEDRNG